MRCSCLSAQCEWVGGKEGGRRPDGVQDAVLLHHLVLFIKAIWLKQESKYIKEAIEQQTAQLKSMSDELWISQ